MTYYLGVDLGTTYTAAAVWRDGQVEVANLGNRAAVIPSVVLLRDDGSMLVGEAAERRAPVEPQRVAREFKRRFGDPTPIIIGGTPYSADALMAKLLRSVVEKVSQLEGAPPTGVAVSHPANWGDYKKDLFAQAVALADLTNVATVTEPEAAAIHYASQERIEPGSVIAVYDLGGGTFDAAVLRKTDQAWEILGEPQGVERLGGVDFDEAIFQHVVAATGDAFQQLDPDDEAAMAAVARLRHECIEAKEALSDDTDVSVPVFLPNLQTEVRITRQEFETMVRPALAGSMSALDRALRVADVKSEDVTTVLLVGGSSRLPLVSGLVSSEIGRPVAIDAHPKYSVALGAAMVAAGKDVTNVVEASQIAAVPEDEHQPAPPRPNLPPPPVVPPIYAPGAGATTAMGAPPPPPGAFGAPPGPGPGAPPPGPGDMTTVAAAHGAPPPMAPPGGGPSGPTAVQPGAPTTAQPSYQATATPPWSGGGGPSGPYSVPSSGGYAPAPAPSNRTPLFIALGIILLVAIGAGIFVATSGGDDDDPPRTTEQAGPTTTSGSGPSSSGVDGGSIPDGCSASRTASECEALYNDCTGGLLSACDELWLATGSGTELEAVAESCGGADTSTEHNGDCVATLGGGGGASTTLAAMPEGCFSTADCTANYEGCASGNMVACDDLWGQTSVGSPLETFSEECGGLDPGSTEHGHCEATFG